jgi:UDP-N-acetylglucosamine enolpyruvyl transferase
LPILAANYLVDKKITLTNLPKIIDVEILDQIGQEYLQK